MATNPDVRISRERWADEQCHDACVGTRSRTLGSLDGLREHLQWAIELEHSTIPPYMCALYSLDRPAITKPPRS